MTTKKRILVLSPLRDGASFKENTARLRQQPAHPYGGSQWADHLDSAGFQVVFANQLRAPRLLPEFLSKGIIGELLKIAIHGRCYDFVVGHSTHGLGRMLWTRLLSRKPTLVYFYLAQPKPIGNRIICLLRAIGSRLELMAADRIICGLWTLQKRVETSTTASGKMILYMPFCVDYGFFTSVLERAGRISLEISGVHFEDFLLVVGDVTRDDPFIFKSFRKIKTQVVRVTRDPRVVSRVAKIEDRSRSDLILSQISFADLALLYSKARACVFASEDDVWQPAGITAIGEALACGAICVVGSGGCVEDEFRRLSEDAGVECPLQFFPYPSSEGLIAKIDEVSNQPKLRRKIQQAGPRFVKTVLDIGRAKSIMINTLH